MLQPTMQHPPLYSYNILYRLSARQARIESLGSGTTVFDWIVELEAAKHCDASNGQHVEWIT